VSLVYLQSSQSVIGVDVVVCAGCSKDLLCWAWHSGTVPSRAW